MPKYKIELCEVLDYRRTVYVEAENKWAAEDLAWEQAGDWTDENSKCVATVSAEVISTEEVKE